MCSNIRILIKIYYICSIFYFIRQIISRRNLIKSRFKSRDLTILRMSCISSIETTKVVLWPGPKIFLCIPASAADAAAVNPNGTKTLLANGLITLFINGNPVLVNGPKSLPKNPPDCIILDNCAFDNLILVDVCLAKVLQRFKTCLLVSNNLWGKLVSSSELPIIFDDSLKTTSVSFFTADLNLLSCEFDSFTFKLLY